LKPKVIDMTAYTCTSCGRGLAGWMARCSYCEQPTVERATDRAALPGVEAPTAEPAPRPSPAAAFVKASLPRSMASIPPPSVPAPSSVPVPSTEVVEQHLPRDATGMAPLDLVLGGGLVAGSVVVLGGPPGSAKSTCLAQALCGLGLRALYATGEETIAQVADRQRRVGATSARVLLVRETELEVILAHAQQLRVAVIAIDSIQTLRCAGVDQAPGSPAQVRACADRCVAFAKDTGVAIILVGHVSKDSSLAGPRTLEHLVDVVMMLVPGRGDVRVLSCPLKNRFGQTRVEGRFLLTPKGLEEATPESAAEALAEERPELCPHCGLPLDPDAPVMS
jgi:DNA repair protein RadA/Sms